MNTADAGLLENPVSSKGKTYEYAKKCEMERTQPQLLDARAQVLFGKKSVASDGLDAIALSFGEAVAKLGEQQATSRTLVAGVELFVPITTEPPEVVVCSSQLDFHGP